MNRQKREINIPLAAIFAICAILFLEILALVNGINGAMFAFALSLIAGLGGFVAGKTLKPK